MAQKLSGKQSDELIKTLEARFAQNPKRHPELTWTEVRERLEATPEKLWALYAMEQSGGDPDVVTKTGEIVFFDCSPESPKGRRSVCYDQAALNARKENKPANSALHMASEMGIEVLDQAQYRELQKYGPFDTKTSSWIVTPVGIRKLGGAIFGDFRYGQVFVYHNGAESYYASRGFRGSLKV